MTNKKICVIDSPEFKVEAKISVPLPRDSYLSMNPKFMDGLKSPPTL